MTTNNSSEKHSRGKFDREGCDPSCKMKPGLPKGNCQGNLRSEDTCDGQPKGYSLSNVISKCYNHIPKENENFQPDGGQCPSSTTSRHNNDEQIKAKKTKQRQSSKKKRGFKESMKKHHLYLEKKWLV